MGRPRKKRCGEIPGVVEHIDHLNEELARLVSRDGETRNRQEMPDDIHAREFEHLVAGLHNDLVALDDHFSKGEDAIYSSRATAEQALEDIRSKGSTARFRAASDVLAELKRLDPLLALFRPSVVTGASEKDQPGKAPRSPRMTKSEYEETLRAAPDKRSTTPSPIFSRSARSYQVTTYEPKQVTLTKVSFQLLALLSYIAACNSPKIRNGWASFALIIALMERMFGITMKPHNLEMIIYRIRRRFDEAGATCFLETHEKRARVDIPLSEREKIAANPIVNEIIEDLSGNQDLQLGL